MSLGRAVGLFRAGTNALRWGSQKTITRKAGGVPHIEPQYRQHPILTKNQKMQAEFMSSVMWFWVLWNFWHNPEAVLGHFEWPDASKWTNEELGIPPDDEE